MAGAKKRTRIDLGPKDAAFIVRRNGEPELLLPDRDGDEEVPPDQIALAGFAMAFHDERLRDLLGQILREKQH